MNTLLLLPLLSRSGANICGFAACKRCLFLLYGTKANGEEGNERLHERVREGLIQSLPLKLLGFELS